MIVYIPHNKPHQSIIEREKTSSESTEHKKSLIVGEIGSYNIENEEIK